MSTSTKRSKNPSVRAGEQFARKDRLARRRLGLEIGDRIRIIDIPSDLKDPNYDLKGAEHREMRTAELFRFCLGREFAIRGFGRFGTVELEASANRAVRKEFGKYQTIWMEPAHLKVIRKKKQQKSATRV